MQSRLLKPRSTQTSARESRRSLPRGLRRLSLLAATLVMALFLSIAPLRALCDTHIFLYTSGGGSVDVTSTLYQDQYGNDWVVYGNPIEVILDFAEGHVYDIGDNLIGYIYSDDPPPN